MSSSILGVGQSALAAAQAGLATTGHNIANASTPGYTRQMVIQGSAGAQDGGFGFVGKGTQVTDIRRVYSELLTEQVRSAETSNNQLDVYYTQISRINNQLGDPTAGLAPSLQDFFSGVQDMAANPGAAASRQSALSSAETLAARFRSLDTQLKEVTQGVNSQIQSSVSNINVYAAQIAKLNDSIEKAQGNAQGKASNDLLDQRDLAITELSKEIKTTIVKQGNSYNVFIGNGQPLVVGIKTFNLVASGSNTDTGRTSVSYVSNGKLIKLDENNLPGGKLGGLFDFRAKSLDTAQNSLGRVALVLATTFNAQHQLGQDQTGALGGEFFVAAAARVDAGAANDTGSAAQVSATISDTSKLTTSDYRLQMIGGNHVITRLSDGVQVYSDPTFPSGPDVIEGVTLSLDSGGFTDGDEFLIRPTADGAAKFSVKITDIARIAAAAPIRTAATASNTGSGTISAGTVNAVLPLDANLREPVTITFTTAGTFDVTGNGTGDPTGLAYTPDGDITYNGWTVKISGTPAAGDTFTLGPNTNGVGDNRNALRLSALQSANTIGTTTYQGAYGQLVSLVGNKARELEVTSKAEARYLEQTVAAQQEESGVNLDEEATNLIRYQQAYQAAAKVMQTASQLFELLLNMGA